ncbi:serine hydroxymethyltransferase [Neomegalonema perideroedes]|uniref:serine hydroxymethyltransferase n=1 Tax=Neomegalonema perideroedes TaxID=217219 RepID=UPI000382117A|nr:beta-eliminating lyase-related protein [Neomegalonema perideroedes]
MAEGEGRTWLAAQSATRATEIAARLEGASSAELRAELDRLILWNRRIHDEDCVNLDPAANVMHPRAEAALAQGLGSRPSLGHAGAKYETGLEAIEEIEEIARNLAMEIFGARFAEIRAPSGALANLMSFMACAKAGDRVITPPAAIGGHVTHQTPGAAGLYGLEVHNSAPDRSGAYTVDLELLREQALRLRPKLISIGGSLNFTPHPVAEIRSIADEVGAKLLFDAAHLSGPIAGGVWPNPLKEGAHLLTMSCYKSLGGPPSGLILTNEPDLAQRLDAIAFPGLTANSDPGKAAALAYALLDWRAPNGPAYARAMVETAQALEAALRAEGLPVYGETRSHQLALEAKDWGGGGAMAQRLRKANLLACAIGLPIPEGDGLRLGTSEMVRRGLTPQEAPELARLIGRALYEAPESVAAEVSAFRRRFTGFRFVS